MTLEHGTEVLRQNEVGVTRTENPLFSSLVNERLHFVRFRDIVNDQLRKQGALPINGPRIERVPDPRLGNINYTLIDIPFNKYSESIEKSLKNLIASVGLSEDSGNDMEDVVEGYPGKQKNIYVLSANLYLDDGIYNNSGILIRGRGRSPEKTGAGTVIINNAGDSEAVLAYQAVVAALIAQGRLDMSTNKTALDSLSLRREIFMNIYLEMLSEKEPFITRDEIFDLDEQIDDIETDLYRPLKKGQGKPMNTILVGAPGVGKSIVGRFFMGDRQVLTLPVSVDKLKRFENGALSIIARVKRMIDIPAVLLVDDVEALLGSSFNIDEQGKMNQVIDPEDRSEALSMLERMEDTYGIYLLCTLNHPDVEAAFLRRFNPVYFPLPTRDQREFMLKKIVPQGDLSNQDFMELINEFSERSEGFNYHGLARITVHFENIMLGTAIRTEEEYRIALQTAFGRAARIVNKKTLARLDAAAKNMVGLSD